MLLPILTLLLVQEGSGPSFAADVQPLLAERCILCHGPDPEERRAGLRLDVREGLESVAPLDAFGESELLRRVRSEDPDERMPPPEHGEALGEEEIAILEAWVAEGAAWQPHWAYAPFREVRVPDGDHANPIDGFVAARLAREGLELAPEATREELVRRLYLDLWGMGPTPEEVQAFVADERPDAYEQLIDRLLGSVHHAERYARHWLDVARYADSHGFTIDGGRSIWPWRDWVIEALHQDMPFDEFTVQQLAGDLLPDADLETRLATGFHRNTQVNQEGGAKDEENRVSAVLDRVNTTGAVWLGSSVACAQCHDHKYDPLSQREYYQLLAFFDQTADGGVSTGPRVTLAEGEQAEAVRQHEQEGQRLQAELRAAEARARGEHRVWEPERWIADNGPELRLQSDGSFIVLGQFPAYTTYTLEGRAPGDVLGSLRLEAIPDPRLRSGGPGRAANFVLDRLRVLVREPAGEGGPAGPWRELAPSSARADFEQDTRPDGGGFYPASGVLLDDSPGWAIKPAFGEPHVLALEFDEAVDVAGLELRVELRHVELTRHGLGSFRITTGSGAAPAELVTEEWTEAARAWVAHPRSRPELPTSMVMERREAPRTTRLFERGNFLTPGEVVEPGFPAAMNHIGGAPPKDRLDLARWLVHPENALVHRVTVNREWQRLFGMGIVETENDFGLRGATPSHPDLLEWLAQEFVAGGMSRRKLQRLILTSRTYRQSSHHRPEAARIDPGNRLLACSTPRRVEAEVIRDSALRASGLLVDTVGGPPVQPPQPDGIFRFTQSQRRWVADEGEGRFRRSLYTRIWRSAAYPFFTTFDAPNPAVTCTRRRPSQTPLQALTLANDPMIVELAAGLATRVLGEEEGDRARLQRSFLLTLSRRPSSEEEGTLLVHLQARREEGLDEPAAWTSIVRVLFNTQEFSTRP